MFEDTTGVFKTIDRRIDNAMVKWKRTNKSLPTVSGLTMY